MRKEDVKIAVFSSYDKIGGSAMTCYDCVKKLRKEGYNAIEVVRFKTCDDDFVYVVPFSKKIYLKKAINKIIPSRFFRDLIKDTDSEYRFFGDESNSFDRCTIHELEKALPFIPNVIFVGHTFNFIDTALLSKIYKRWNSHIYLTCTDISPYTAGCHVHWDCKGYKVGCDACPAALDESRKHEIEKLFKKKRKNIVEGNIGVRYANNWLRREIEESLMFKDAPLFFSGQNTDIDLYNPQNRNIAKQVFGIPNNAKIIMNGSCSLDDKRKGFVYFCEAMQQLYHILPENIRNEVTLFIIGKNRESVQYLIEKFPDFSVKIIDYITDSRLMSLAYQATDVYVGTSLEDAGPMMVSDSLACGTPVVGFRTGFFDDEDIVQDGKIGYTVELRDVTTLADRISRVLQLSPKEFEQMSANCRKVAEDKLSKYRTLERYIELFTEL